MVPLKQNEKPGIQFLKGKEEEKRFSYTHEIIREGDEKGKDKSRLRREAKR